VSAFTADAAASGRREIPPLWLLALLTFSGTLGMHIFAPALSAAARDLQVGAGAIQETISLYIVGLAIGQLGYGPLSDRFGRRPVLMVGLAVYTIGGLAAVFAPGVGSLVAARFVQALGGGAGLALGRAMVRDTSAKDDATRRLALLNLMVTIGPGVAPTLGGVLVETLGWRSILWGLCALGVALVALAYVLLPETAPRSAKNNAGDLVRSYGGLLRSPLFLGFAIGGGAATTSMYAFVAASPFIVVEQMHRPAYEIGLYLAVLIGGVWVGNALASRLVALVRRSRLMIFGNLTSVLAAAALLAAAATGHLSAGLVLGPMFIFTIGAGLAGPMALTEAISADPKVIGSAAGLYGFLQMAIGAICTALTGFSVNAALNAAIVLAGAQVVAQAAFWIALSVQGRGTRGPE
jgi:MFS transporter, DHA1 family, multidrug resistance protein